MGFHPEDDDSDLHEDEQLADRHVEENWLNLEMFHDFLWHGSNYNDNMTSKASRWANTRSTTDRLHVNDCITPHTFVWLIENVLEEKWEEYIRRDYYENP